MDIPYASTQPPPLGPSAELSAHIAKLEKDERPNHKARQRSPLVSPRPHKKFRGIYIYIYNII